MQDGKSVPIIQQGGREKRRMRASVTHGLWLDITVLTGFWEEMILRSFLGCADRWFPEEKDKKSIPITQQQKGKRNKKSIPNKQRTL